MNRIDRLFGILLMLQSQRRVRAVDIAQRFEISERTVYRDVSALMQLGVPIVSQAGEGYAMMEGFYLPPLVLTPEEASALFLGVKMLIASGNLPRGAEDALSKLTAALPARTLHQVQPLADVIEFYAERGKFDLNAPRIIELQRAIREKRVLRVVYQGLRQDTVSEREIEPFKLTYSVGRWYLAAYCRMRREIRSFRVDRMHEVIVTDAHFTSNHENTPEADQPIIEVTLRFPRPALRMLRERQHYGYQSELPDGDHVLMTYHIHTLSEIQGWVMAWGTQVEVIEPQALREHILSEAQKLVSLLT